MAKKPEEFQPVVTRLNLPISEESLMVDLPDGQKLVIGKMATGSVIEVATWRGTGRPDSRTTRMMLGMSGGADVVATQQSAAEGTSPAAPEQAGDFTTKAVNFLKSQFVAKDKPAKAPKPAKIESEPKEKKSRFSFVKAPDFTAPSIESSEPGSKPVTTSEFDIESWLQEISSKPATVSAKAVAKPATTSKTSRSTKTAASTKSVKPVKKTAAKRSATSKGRAH